MSFEKFPDGLDDHFYRYVLPLVVIESILWLYAFLSDVRTCQVTLGLLGLWWCLAALWVEIKIEQTYPGFEYDNPPDPEMKEYRPFCDFSPWATCSKVLMSPSGRFLRYFGIAKPGGGEGWIDTVRGWIDVPNPSLGVIFFSCHLFYNVLVDIVYIFKPLAPLFDLFNVLLPWCFFLACCGVGCMCIWLGYKLFVVLQDFCVVCVSMYITNFALIPVMYGICYSDSNAMRGFGEVPGILLYPFLALDAIMFVAVLGLYFMGKHKAEAREAVPYIRLI